MKSSPPFVSHFALWLRREIASAVIAPEMLPRVRLTSRRFTTGIAAA